MFAIFLLFLDKQRSRFENYRVEYVSPDGNCMFSSLALQLGKSESSHHVIRLELMDYLRQHPSIVSIIFCQYRPVF